MRSDEAHPGVNAYGEQYLKAGIPQIVAGLSVILPQLSFPGDPEPWPQVFDGGLGMPAP